MKGGVVVGAAAGRAAYRARGVGSLVGGAQFRIGAGEHGADGARSDAEAGGDVAFLRVLPVAHDDDGALALWQARDQLAQVAQLGGDHAIFRRRQLRPLVAGALVILKAGGQPREGDGGSTRGRAHIGCDPVAVALHERRRDMTLREAERAGEEDFPRLVISQSNLGPQMQRQLLEQVFAHGGG